MSDNFQTDIYQEVDKLYENTHLKWQVNISTRNAH